MTTVLRSGAGLLCAGMILAAGSAARAQVPNQMYMQGVFLQTNGITPTGGVHAVTISLYTNSPTAALAVSTNLAANNSGVADFVLSSSRLPEIFQTCTNVTFQMTGGAVQSFVSAPYAFQAANLPEASGNFTVQGDLTVASNASLAALTAENGGTLAPPITVGQYATLTNVSTVTFSKTLEVAGGMKVEGVMEAHYQARFSNTSATASFYGDTNNVIMSNAVVSAPFTMISTNYDTGVGSSGTAPVDGFLMIWITVAKYNTHGVDVKIGTNLFNLTYAADADSGRILNMFNGASFPVPKGTSWSAMNSNSDDGTNVAFKCYWLPLDGGG